MNVRRNEILNGSREYEGYEDYEDYNGALENNNEIVQLIDSSQFKDSYIKVFPGKNEGELIDYNFRYGRDLVIYYNPEEAGKLTDGFEGENVIITATAYGIDDRDVQFVNTVNKNEDAVVTIPSTYLNEALYITVSDEYGRLISDYYLTAEDFVNYGHYSFISVLASEGEMQSLMYLKGFGSELRSISETDIFSEEVLEIGDVIVADYERYSTVVEDKKEMIEHFVKNGGSLAIYIKDKNYGFINSNDIGEVVTDLDYGEGNSYEFFTMNVEDTTSDAYANLNNAINNYEGALPDGYYSFSLQRDYMLWGAFIGSADNASRVKNNFVEYDNEHYSARTIMTALGVPEDTLIKRSVVDNNGYCELYTAQYGEGNILYFPFDIRMEEYDMANFKEDPYPVYPLFYDAIAMNIMKSTSKQRDNLLGGEYYSYGNFDNAMFSVEAYSYRGKYSIMPFAAILATYILVLIPLVFILAKKMKRPKMFWKGLGISSVITAIIMCAVGDKSRVKQPFNDSMNILIAEDEGDKDSAELEAKGFLKSGICFVDDNDKKICLKDFLGRDFETAKDIKFNYGKTHYPDFYENWYYGEYGSELYINGSYLANPRDQKKIFEKLNLAAQIVEDKEGDGIIFRDVRPFVKEYFEAEYKCMVKKCFEGDMHLGPTGLSGVLRFNGDVEEDLKNVVIVAEGIMVLINGLEKGVPKEINLEECTQVFRGNDSILYSEENWMDFLGEDYEKSAWSYEGESNISSFRSILKEIVDYSTGCYICAWSEEIPDKNVTSNGITTYIYPIEVDRSVDGGVFVSNIREFITNYGGVLSDETENIEYALASNIVYTLPEGMELSELVYTEFRNPEVTYNPYYESSAIGGFKGEIMLYNYKEQRFEVMFNTIEIQDNATYRQIYDINGKKFGEDGLVFDLSRYVSEDGIIRIRLNDQSDNYTFMPVISAVLRKKD